MVLNDRVLEETDILFPCELSLRKLFAHIDTCIIDKEFCCDKVASSHVFWIAHKKTIGSCIP